MAKQLNQVNVNLAFTADTGKAKVQLQDLQKQLNNLINAPSQGLGFSKEIEKATNLAAKLKVSLEDATNVKTGKLDLGKFNESLSRGNVTLKDYQDALNDLGPAGTKAFAALSQSIMQAEIPIRRSNAMLTEMFTTLKNTARWQISSSILHGFMGSVQSAYGYAQRLDESLNNIRIVTGQNTEQMAKFAIEANKAAKALSTTTTEYTNASLIYYQQGLSDQEVQERTNVTVKMANVSRESAETVSDQLTAVWNNFDDGTKSLEYYADVMTALGAATASSTAEISEGLNKFAAVAETVGLSYEYATSALATVTATTRESADIVGTAFKTLFARIQGLSLGETLDDGTTLNKYSEALKKVGISIFEQNGQMKEMDAILDAMGSKWSALSKDQQTALAQTVAGVRQYTQLIALMDNWDFFQKNLNTAMTSNGALEEQADIYAESWEASEKRVKAAAEKIYDSLLDEDLFIEFNNVLEKLLTGAGALIDSLGGLPGVLSAVGAALSQAFGPQLTSTFDRLIYNIQMITPAGKEAIERTRKEINALMVQDLKDMDTIAGYAAAEAYKEQAVAQQALLDNARKLSDEEQRHAQLLLDSHARQVDNVVTLGQEVQLAEEKVRLLEKSIEKQLVSSAARNGISLDEVRKLAKNAQVVELHLAKINEIFYQLSTVKLGDSIDTTKLTALSDEIKAEFGVNINEYCKKGSIAFERLGAEGAKSLQKLMTAIENGSVNMEIYSEVMDNLVYNSGEKVNALIEILKKSGIEESKAIDIANKLSFARDNLGDKTAELTEAQSRLKSQTSQINTFLDNAKGPVQTLGSVFTASTQAITSFATVLTSVKGIVDTLNNTEMGFGEKFLTVFTQLAFVVPNVVHTIKNVSNVFGPSGFLGVLQANKAAMSKLVETYPILIQQQYAEGISRAMSAKYTDSQTQKLLMHILAQNAELSVKEKEVIVETLLTNKRILLTKATIKSTAAQLAGNAVHALKKPLVYGTIAAITALVAITYAHVKAQNADAEAAKQAAKTAEKLRDSANEAKQELQNIQNAIDAYDSAIKTLDECTKGTDEWRDALKEVNEQIWEILEKYPDLAKLDNLFNDDGTLNKDVINSYIADKEQQAHAAQAAAAVANARAGEAANTAAITGVKQNLQKQFKGDQADVVSQAVDSFILKLQDPEYSIDTFKEELQQLGPAFVEVGDRLRELAKDFGTTGQQIENVGKLVGREFLGDSATDDQLEAFSQSYAGKEQSLYDDIYNDLNNTSRLDTKASISDIWNRYLASTGEDLQLATNAIVGGKDNKRIRYVGEDGNPVELSIAEIAAKIASNEAGSSAESDVRQQILSAFGEDAKFNDDVSTSLINDLAQHLDLSNQTTLETVKALLTDAEGNILSADEQKRIIEELIAKATPEQTDEAKAAAVRSEAESKYGLDPKLVEEQAKQLQSLYGAEKLTKEEATKLAVENQRMNKGVEDLIDNWEDWNKELKAGQLDKNKKGTVQYAKTIKDLTKTIADLTGASADLELPEDFFDNEDNLNLIGKAAQGSEQAINELGVAVGKAQVEMMSLGDESVKFVQWYDENGFLATMSADTFNTYKNQVLAGIKELQTQVAAGVDLTGKGLEDILSTGAEGANSWIESLNQMAIATRMSVEDMNSMLNSMGLEADVTITEKQVISRKPVTLTSIKKPVYDDYGNMLEYETSTSTIRYDDIPETIQIAQIATNGKQAGQPNVKYVGNGSVSPTSSSKKSGGSSKKNEGAPKRSSTVKRYKEVDDSLDNISKEMAKVNREVDQLYGSARISKMKTNVSLLEKEVKLLEKKQEEAKKYLEIDKAALKKAAAEAGVSFNFGEDGTISNYTEQMNILHDKLEAAYAAAGDTISETEQKLIDAIQKHIDNLTDAIEAYDDTLNVLEDMDDSIEEKMAEIMSENYSILTYELELKLEIDEADLQRIDFMLNQLSDDFYKMAEAAALMVNQLDPYQNSLNSLGEHYDKLTAAYNANEISQADYIDGLKETRDSIYDQLNAMVDLDKEMMNYYGDTLSAASDELQKYTSHMEHLTEVIDHYMSMMELMGKSSDYNLMGDIFVARQKTLEDQLAVAQSNYDMLVRQKAQIEQRMASETEGSAAWEVYKKEWDAIVEAVDNAQKELLSKTEEHMEAVRAVIENEMNKAAKTLEASLTGGLSFDFMMSELEKLNARQEEYLTKTNQVYETNKLMRQAAQAADKTDNAVAKQKFKNFAEETKQLQEKGQLSKYELEIQQAKYDLLLAQIALEDAQNAKSTVRLQRDSEGNFGYVYTADQDKIADAQQAVEDAENDLYNISLEGQQDYTEKYTQALSDMYDEMRALQEAYFNGDIATEEEYQSRKEALLNHYFGVPNGVLTTYSNLYNIAVQTDSKATADFWGKDYGNMTKDTEEFKDAFKKYFDEVGDKTKEWHDKTKDYQDAVIEGLDDLVNESEDYADTINDEVIPAIEDELNAVERLTHGYAQQREEIQRTIEKYKQLVQAINESVAAAANGSGGSGGKKEIPYDVNADYSSLMVQYHNTEDYETYKQYRNRKLLDPEYKGEAGKVKTEWIDTFLDKEYSLADFGASSFMQLSEDQWKEILGRTVQLDTGGYTGEWGPEGKLAVVHEKEIMLNADDTVNFLKAIDITRTIIDAIDSQAKWASAGIGMLSASGVGDSYHTLEQEVTIHAEFPNATDHNEIEEAFRNLMNTASQYANRKI